MFLLKFKITIYNLDLMLFLLTKFVNSLDYSFDADFQIESYLRHQGFTFVDRFDANSYLYITRAMDYFDVSSANNGSLIEAFKKTQSKILCVSFTSDWLYPTSENKKIVKFLTLLGLMSVLLKLKLKTVMTHFYWMNQSFLRR